MPLGRAGFKAPHAYCGAADKLFGGDGDTDHSPKIQERKVPDSNRQRPIRAPHASNVLESPMSDLPCGTRELFNGDPPASTLRPRVRYAARVPAVGEGVEPPTGFTPPRLSRALDSPMSDLPWLRCGFPRTSRKITQRRSGETRNRTPAGLPLTSG